MPGRTRTVVLFSDATILTETPPLRAAWARAGQQAEVPITGNRDRRVLFGAIAVGRGTLRLDRAGQWNQDSFQSHLRHFRPTWRGWRIVLFLDRGSPHTARRSRALAKQFSIELRFLPTACPELNPMEGLWREIKGQILANEPTPELDVSLECAVDHLMAMTGKQRRQTARILSENFWLAT
ncbi:transposase [Isosphaeraceae bacterium EP7]